MRPEHLTLSFDEGKWQGVVGIAEHLGSDTFIRVDIENVGAAQVRVTGDFAADHGDRVFVTPVADKFHRFDAQGLAL